MKNKLFAFWRYDLFPFTLGGEVVRLEDDGVALIKEYDCRFRPKKLMPLQEGRAVHRELTALRAEYQEAKNKLDERFRRRAEKLAPWIKKE